LSDTALLIIAKLGFYGTVGILIYIVYYEFTSYKIRSQKAELKLKEEENENRVNSLTPDELIDLVNSGKEPGSTESGSDGKGPT
jgi:hypothetical protein